MIGPKSKLWAEMYDKYVGRTYNSLPIVPKRARGIYMWDCDGRRYIDFWASYSAVNLGHAHPRILKALNDAVAKGMITRAVYVKELAILAKKLSELAGFDAMIIPKNSGVEAVETAIKHARLWAYQIKGLKRGSAEIIVAAQNFHGRTITVISFSSEPLYRDDFGPHTPGFKIVDYGNSKKIGEVINENTAAVLLEPVQGEGGIIFPAEDGYLNKVRDICDQNNILMILDEIQTGLGRTGKMFCHDYSKIKPDIILIGKALSGGVYPISAEIARRDLMELWKPGHDGSTFAGNSIACSVALEALDIIIDENLCERSAELGKYFLVELKKIKHPLIKDVRGLGLFLGIEFYPKAGGARKYCEKLLNEAEIDMGIICKEAHEHVLRLSPPLVIEKGHIDFFVQKFQKVLED